MKTYIITYRTDSIIIPFGCQNRRAKDIIEAIEETIYHSKDTIKKEDIVSVVEIPK